VGRVSRRSWPRLSIELMFEQVMRVALPLAG
jgi:hypothetical protein